MQSLQANGIILRPNLSWVATRLWLTMDGLSTNWVMFTSANKCADYVKYDFERLSSGHFEYESMGEPSMTGYDVYLQSKNKKLTLGLKGVFNLDDNKMSNSYAVILFDDNVDFRRYLPKGRLCRFDWKRPFLQTDRLQLGNWWDHFENSLLK
jgi:hypothetical protein